MLTMRSRIVDTIPVEAECVTPDRLRTLSLAEIADLPVYHGRLQCKLGDFFSIDGDPTDGDIRLEGNCSTVKWLGAGMTRGKLSILGSAGMHLGSGMTGGTIEVGADVDLWCGAEMRGGRIHVRGSAQDKLGAAYPGSMRGMRGGVILVDGDAGDDVGAVMRRGTIAVRGNVGAFAGAAMIAGTIFVLGSLGPNPGAGLKRGTIACFGPPPKLLPTFLFDCTYRPPFLTLYLKALASWGFSVTEGTRESRWDHYRGDIVSLGKGEILVRRS